MATDLPQDGHDDSSQAPKWQALSPSQRRVLGVLVEKAKTTPDAYPLSLNGLTTGCNQKSNRAPQMNLSTDQVEEVLESLRTLGATGEVQTGGRVPKYKHYAYDWLGVDKAELAVMTELLLRGEQTLGDLRSRVARMEPICDQSALRPIVDSLIAKNLVRALTPAGRGQIVTHTLYKQREIEQLEAQHRGGTSSNPLAAPDAAAPAPQVGQSPAPPTPAVTLDMFNELQLEVTQLRAELNELRRQIND